MAVPFFGAPAPLPIGPALIAIETGAPVYAVGVRRLSDGRIAGRLIPIPTATSGTRRERIGATLAAMAEAFERMIADAPEQWTAVFFPIWADLSMAGATTSATAGSDEAAP